MRTTSEQGLLLVLTLHLNLKKFEETTSAMCCPQTGVLYLQRLFTAHAHTVQVLRLGTPCTHCTKRTKNDVRISLQGFLNTGPQMPEPEYLLTESTMCTQTAFLSTSTAGKQHLF